MIQTILFNADKSFPDKLAKQLSAAADLEKLAASTMEAAETMANERAAVVLVIGPAVEAGTALALAEKLTRSHPGAGCVLIADNPTADLLKKALRAGFRDVVDNDPRELLSAVRHAFELIPAGTAAPRDAEPTEKTAGGVISFFSTKGGVGKTFFAVNTAVGLAKRDAEVILLDLDHYFGDVGVMMGLKPDRTLGDLVPAFDRLDEEMLKSFLTKHESGIKVLLAPVRQDISQRISQSDMQKLIGVARRVADFVIVDTRASFAENTLTILDESDCVFLATTLDVPSVKSTHVALQTLKMLNYPEDKIKLLLNRADSKVLMTTADVEKHLKRKVAVEIPSSLAVPKSINEGVPLLMEDQKSSVASAINTLVELAAGVKPRIPEAGILERTI